MLVTHGDGSAAQCPQPGSVVTVTPAAVAVYSCAHALYEAALASGVDLNSQALQMRLTADFGMALHRLLDACHDLLER